jgi:pimeloyl-ACP methyl ester carboxylesterase
VTGTDRYVEANGIRQHFIDYPGDGPTLILTPGLTANARFFDGLIDAGLAPALRVVAADLRGRGETDQPDSGYTMADHAADIIGLMDHLEIDRAVLGGHSFGGLLTYYMAAELPDRVRRCVVIDAPGEVSTTIVEQIQPSLDRLETTFESWEAYLAFVKAMPYYPDGWWDEHLEAFYRSEVVDVADGGVRPGCRPDHIRQAVEGTLVPDWPDLVSRIEQPTLLVRATEPFGPPGYPPILPEDAARRTLGSLRDGRLVDLPGNHITALFGESAARAAHSIVDFVMEETG